MISLAPGGNAPLNATDTRIIVTVSWSPGKISGRDVDASAFLLNSIGKVRTDEDMVFYNQPEGSGGAVRVVSSSAAEIQFAIDTAGISPQIDKVAFVSTIHEAGQINFGSADRAAIEIKSSQGVVLIRYDVETRGRTEAALILGELYRRNDQWKFRAIGQGFNGGLGPLARHFGVDVSEEAPSSRSPISSPAAAAPAAPTPATPVGAPAASPRVSLEKRLISLQKKDPELVSLVKKVQVSLEKKNLLTDRAKVALVLDISASMDPLYKAKAIDHLVQRVMALGYRFDDNGAIDVFLFGANAQYWNEVGVDDYRSMVKTMLDAVPLEGSTYYANAMSMVRNHYADQDDWGRIPVYVMFVTDGDTFDKELSERHIRESSREAIFWQFMAIGKRRSGLFGRGSTGFDFLERLDTMPGRMVDNAGFMLVADPRQPSDESLFEDLMKEYPGWLRAAQAKGILKN